MALPKQVQAQLAEVEELERSMSARKGQPEDDETSDAAEPEETEETESDLETEEAAKTEGAKPADESSTDVADDFRQKYNTLKGKYDAEVPRLYEQVRGLTDQIAELRAQLAEKETADEPTKPEEKVSYVTDADREEFGEELIDVQRRVAREVAQEYEQQLKAQSKVIDELRKQVNQTGNQVGEMSFTQRLHALVPDFTQIDHDERWVQWLDEHDPMLRGPRRIQAKAAYDNGDAEAVAHYVRLFKESLDAGAEKTAADAQRQAELEKQVTPGRSAASASRQSSDKAGKVYSQGELDRNWAKIRTLNSCGRYEDAAKLEAELTVAYLEGRVRA